MNNETLPSRIWLAAWIAAEEALNAESKALIDLYDTAHKEWRESGYGPIPDSVTEARRKVEADPCASVAFECRGRCNAASADEYTRKEEAALAGMLAS